MFDIGFWELITIAVITVVIVRPEKLHEFTKDTGKLLKNLRRYVQNAKKEFTNEMNIDEVSELQNSINHVEKLMDEAPDKNIHKEK